MKVKSDKHGEVVRHYRTIEIEDGPMVDAGEGEYSSYYPGTMFQATKLKMEWTGDAEPVTVEVSGPYTGSNGAHTRNYSKRYRLTELPAWIAEILQ